MDSFCLSLYKYRKIMKINFLILFKFLQRRLSSPALSITTEKVLISRWKFFWCYQNAQFYNIAIAIKGFSVLLLNSNYCSLSSLLQFCNIRSLIILFGDLYIVSCCSFLILEAKAQSFLLLFATTFRNINNYIGSNSERKQQTNV